MDTTVRIETDNDVQLQQLADWLHRQAGSQVRLGHLDRLPAAGQLGTAVDTLLVVLAPGGAAVALVSGLFAWLQSRRSEVQVRLTRADGSSVELTTKGLRGVSLDGLSTDIARMAAWAGGGRADERRADGTAGAG